MVSTLFATAQGKMVDWTHVLTAGDRLLIRTSPARGAKISTWIDAFTISENVTTVDASAAWACFTIHGAAAASAVGLSRLPAPHEVVSKVDTWFVRGLAAYGPCLDAYVRGAAARSALLAHLEGAGVVQMTESEAEIMRLRAGVPAMDGEFPAEVNPLELRLTQHAVGWNKGCYVGQEVISRLDSYDKVARLLMGFTCDAIVDPMVPMKLSQEGRPLGRVTSWTTAAGRSLGLAIIKREAAHPSVAELETSAGRLPVELVDRPFWAASA